MQVQFLGSGDAFGSGGRARAPWYQADKAASSDLSLHDEPPPQSQPITATTAR